MGDMAEIFRDMKDYAEMRRRERHDQALAVLEEVKTLVDEGSFSIDPNFTWNMKIRGQACQY